MRREGWGRCSVNTGVLGWTDEQLAYRDAVRRFVDAELVPIRDELEFGAMPPYEVMRAFYKAFDLRTSAIDRFEASISGQPDPQGTRSAAETLIPMIEFSRHSPGLVTAMGVSVSMAAGSILRAGTREQKERWARDLVALDKIGAWAISEPESGSDAFGAMRSTAKPDGRNGWILNGSKTFITNGPFAETIVFICKLDDGRPIRDREVMTFILDAGMPGLHQSAPLRKMGLHSSPTGELVVSDVQVGEDRLLRDRHRAGSGAATSASRREAKSAFAKERASVTAMALGIIDRCLQLSVDHARTRTQFDRPIGDFQLIQLKLAEMEVARMNVENLVLRYVASADAGLKMPLAEASAMKLYAAQSAVRVALEAVQVFGGNGYMSENQVEQLCRDAKVLQIYGGADEIQVTHIAKGLLRGSAR
jgi:alkylation response protein AidB-like acyl-CoA dehydrogenase